MKKPTISHLAMLRTYEYNANIRLRYLVSKQNCQQQKVKLYFPCVIYNKQQKETINKRMKGCCERLRTWRNVFYIQNSAQYNRWCKSCRLNFGIILVDDVLNIIQYNPGIAVSTIMILCNIMKLEDLFNKLYPCSSRW